MKSLLLLLLLPLIVACTNKTEKEAGESEDRLCYVHAENKDTVNMTITIRNKNVSGELTYNLFEKDRNDGQLTGSLAGDTIFAEYKFQSEGTTSIREVAFLLKGTLLIEGIGTPDSTGMRFENHRDLTFTGIQLQKTDCN